MPSTDLRVLVTSRKQGIIACFTLVAIVLHLFAAIRRVREIEPGIEDSRNSSRCTSASSLVGDLCCSSSRQAVSPGVRLGPIGRDFHRHFDTAW